MIVGNFRIRDCWCDISCVHGHEVEIININRGHFGVCKECKKYIFLGSNLRSSWRHEDKQIWRKNAKIISTFTEAERG